MLISIKANCIDSTAPPEQVFAQEVEKLRQEKFFPKEQLTLEPYERDHAVSHALHPPPLDAERISLICHCRLYRRILLTTTFRWCRQFTDRRSLCRDLMILELGFALFYCYLMIQGVLSVGWLLSLRFGMGERRRSWASSIRLFTCNATRVFYYILRGYGRPKTSRYPSGSLSGVDMCYNSLTLALRSLSRLKEPAETRRWDHESCVWEKSGWWTATRNQQKPSERIPRTPRRDRVSPREMFDSEYLAWTHIVREHDYWSRIKSFGNNCYSFCRRPQ